jgi:hypothetical protein
MISIIFGLISLELAFLSLFSGLFIFLQRYRVYRFGEELKRRVKQGKKVNLQKSVDNFLESDIIDFKFSEMVE